MLSLIKIVTGLFVIRYHRRLKMSQITSNCPNCPDLSNKLKEIYPKLYINHIRNDNLQFTEENDNGFVEYKRTLVGCSGRKAEKYATQMRWRMSENTKSLSAIYYLGVDDNGSIYKLTENDLIESIRIFIEIAEKIATSIVSMQIIDIGTNTIIKICVKNKRLKDNYVVEFDS